MFGGKTGHQSYLHPHFVDIGGSSYTPFSYLQPHLVDIEGPSYTQFTE